MILGSFILGERKWFVMIPVALLATSIVWYLVQVVLGIYLRPLPGFIQRRGTPVTPFLALYRVG